MLAVPGSEGGGDGGGKKLRKSVKRHKTIVRKKKKMEVSRVNARKKGLKKHSDSVLLNRDDNRDLTEREKRERALYEQPAFESIDDEDDDRVEVLDVIKIAMEMSLLGQRALIDFLFRDETQQDLLNASDNDLIESLESEFYDRACPTSVRGSMLWRFATTIWDFPRGNKKTHLKLALTAFDLLLEWCDPYEHPIEYAALNNSLEQAEHAFHRVVLAEKLEKGNNENKWDVFIEDDILPRVQGLQVFAVDRVEDDVTANKATKNGDGAGGEAGKKKSAKKVSKKKKKKPKVDAEKFYKEMNMFM